MHTFELDCRPWKAACGDLAGGDVRDSVWLNDGAGEFTQIPSPFTGDQGLAVALADFDGDGDLDAVFCHDAGMSATHKVYVWKNAL